MRFVKVQPRHYKRSDYVRGTNQYVVVKKMRRPQFGSYIAAILFVTSLSYALFNHFMMPVFAAKEIVSPLAKQEVATQSATIATVEKTQVDEFMKNQQEMNEYVLEWMKTQEFINKQVFEK